MFRYAVIFQILCSPAVAEVCDRSEYPLKESKEADNPVQETRINFTYESGVIIHTDGARETVYCIRNDESAPIYVKWHGPKPDLLFESYAAGRGNGAMKRQRSFTSTTTEDRKIEYGLSRNYGKETNGETITFADSVTSAQIIPVQATPLDLVGLTMPEVLASADQLNRYLDAYQNDPEGGNEVVIWTYASNWLPADTEVLARLAAGEEIEGFDGPYIPVSYGLRSAIDIKNRVATSSVRFWFGYFMEDSEAYALALENGIRERLSVVTANAPFSALADLDTDATYPLSEVDIVLRRDVLEAKVGGGATAQILPWTVGLTFDGVPFSAMQAELFAN